jgi:hypothetical protein
MNRSTRLLSIKMAFIPTFTFCSPHMSRLKPICKIYRRLVLWATGAASTTKHGVCVVEIESVRVYLCVFVFTVENLLTESAMFSIDDTLTTHTESTWTKRKCFHDRHVVWQHDICVVASWQRQARLAKSNYPFPETGLFFL